MTDTRHESQEIGVHTKKLQDAYSTEAEFYEAIRFESFHGAFHHGLVCRAINTALCSNLPGVVVDCPTGTGRILPTLAARMQKVFAVDVTSAMLNVARNRAKKHELRNVEFFLADAQNLPFPDNSIDIIVSLRFFHLLPLSAYDPFLEEIHRVLKPGGTAIIEFANARFGLLANWIKYAAGTKTSVSYVSPLKLPSVVRQFRQVKYQGLYFPLASALARISLPLAQKISKSCSGFPLNSICYELLVRCTK